ncbi:hypothetical protein ACOMHN_045639 [Nucella lapillus]
MPSTDTADISHHSAGSALEHRGLSDRQGKGEEGGKSIVPRLPLTLLPFPMVRRLSKESVGMGGVAEPALCWDISVSAEVTSRPEGVSG